MTKRTVAAGAAAMALAGVVSVQAARQQPDATDRRLEAQAAVESALQTLRALRPGQYGQCTMPDKTTRRVNETVTFNGWTYRCVEIFDTSFVSKGVSWAHVADVPHDGR